MFCLKSFGSEQALNPSRDFLLELSELSEHAVNIARQTREEGEDVPDQTFAKSSLEIKLEETESRIVELVSKHLISVGRKFEH